MMRMMPESKKFLEEYLPAALKVNTVDGVLSLLYEWIDENGFAPPKYEDYNDLGREAQRVYDDIFFSSLSEEELEEYMNRLKKNYE